jgi:hypothetical protein
MAATLELNRPPDHYTGPRGQGPESCKVTQARPVVRSGSDVSDDAPHVSRADPSGTGQSDGGHPSADLARGESLAAPHKRRPERHADVHRRRRRLLAPYPTRVCRQTAGRGCHWDQAPAARRCLCGTSGFCSIAPAARRSWPATTRPLGARAAARVVACGRQAGAVGLVRWRARDPPVTGRGSRRSRAGPAGLAPPRAAAVSGRRRPARTATRRPPALGRWGPGR